MNHFEGIPEAIYSDIKAMIIEEKETAEAKEKVMDEKIFCDPTADIEALKRELEIQNALVQGLAKAFQVAYEYKSGERIAE